jgi:FMN-dependent NADH-azoreductase
MKILYIQSSPNGESSSSRKVSDYLVNKLSNEGSNTVKILDLAKNPLPHVNGLTVSAFFSPADSHSAEQKSEIKLSDEKVAELMDSDAIVISTPMWNFGMPSVLKAWIDHVVRAGKTFSYSPEGLKGLVQGKKGYLVISSGSVFSEGAFASYDHIVPSLKTALGFIGITDVVVIRVEGTNTPEAAQNAILKAKAQVDQLIR